MMRPKRHPSQHRRSFTADRRVCPGKTGATARIGGLTLLLVVLGGMCGCDGKSTSNTRLEPQAHSPTSTADIVPPKPIDATSLPVAEGRLNVDGAFPGPGEERVALVSPISVTFADPLMAGQDLTHAIQVSTDTGQIAGKVTLEAMDTLIFRPNDMWQPNTRYTIEVDSTLMSAEGLLAHQALRWEFRSVADVHTTPQSIIDLCMSELDVEMLAAVNQARSVARSCGQMSYDATGKLHWSCLLQEAAISHTQDMAKHGFFAHQGSDGSNFAQRILRTGYPARVVGENLAEGYTTVADVMVGWLNSSEHCSTLMTPEFTEFGLGHMVTDNWDYWTQNFARPGTP